MNILLVDRSPALRVRMVCLLTELPEVGVVTAVPTLTEAREAMGILHPDILIVGLDQEGESGAQILREIRSRELSLYVIALTNDPSLLSDGQPPEVADRVMDRTHHVPALVETLTRRARAISEHRGAA